MTTTYLAHYGVKGMKWGVRKSRKKKQNPKLMTTKDLSTKVQRMRLEKQYKEMSSPKKTLAKKIVIGALSTVGTVALSTAVRKYTNDALNARSSNATKKAVSVVSKIPTMSSLMNVPVTDDNALDLMADMMAVMSG